MYPDSVFFSLAALALLGWSVAAVQYRRYAAVLADKGRSDGLVVDRDARVQNLVAETGDLRQEIASRDARIAALEPLVYVDALTGIGNSRKFDYALPSHVAHAIRGQEPLVVLYLDVNRFKSVNDTFGHPFGDKFLKRIAGVLKDSIRPTDAAFRIGGDEFVVILVDCDVDGAVLAAERITRTLSENAISCEDALVPLLVSIGGSCLETEGGQILVSGKFEGSFNEANLHEKIATLLRQGADNRLYVAKLRSGGDLYPIEIS